jgi:hypothetical protein
MAVPPQSPPAAISLSLVPITLPCSPSIFILVTMEKNLLLPGHGEHEGSRKRSYGAGLGRRIRLRWVGRVWLLGTVLLLTYVFREELKIPVLLNESMREMKLFGWDDVGTHFPVVR